MSRERHPRQLLLALLAPLVLLMATPANAQVITENFMLTLRGTPLGNRFGSSIAIDHDIVAVGSPYTTNQRANVSSGTVLLYDATTGNQLARLFPEDGRSGDGFGESVAIANGVVAVGAPHHDANAFDSGAVYLFDAATGAQIRKVIAADGEWNDLFGTSVAIADGVLAVGAINADVHGHGFPITDVGAVYLFNIATGAQRYKLFAVDKKSNDWFGISVAIENEIVVVGSKNDNNENGANAGSAYFFDASTGHQIAKIRANDGSESDGFGISVAINNGVVVVGSTGDDTNGNNAGSGYLFDVSTTAQLAKLLPNDGNRLDEFGVSVAIDNGVVLVGSWRDDDHGNQSGSAYTFDANTGNQLLKLLDVNGSAGDEFGGSVAIGNGTIAIGASRDDGPLSDSGSAVLFDASSGAQRDKLSLPGFNGARLGEAAALSDDLIAVIGSGGDQISGIDSGAAYLFDLSAGSQSIGKIFPNDGTPGDRFGQAVAIDANTVVVGARGDDDNGPNSGSAYIFDATTRDQIAKLLPNDGDALGFFGWSVAISNGVGAVGDDQQAPFAGAAYLFDATTGVQMVKLLPTDGSPNSLFGNAIAIDNGIVAVGAWGESQNGSNAGGVYLFDATTGEQLAKLLASDGAPGDQFGNSVALFNGMVAVGAFHDDDNGDRSGSLYLFDVQSGTQLAKLLPLDGAPGDQFGISVSFDIIRGQSMVDIPAVVVGADQNNAHGSAYLFNANTGEQILQLASSDGRPGDSFGSSVAIKNGFIVVGAQEDDEYGLQSGSAFGFLPNFICPADLNLDGELNFFDVSLFVNLFSAQDLRVDFNGDGSFDAFDVSAFLGAFGAGCP